MSDKNPKSINLLEPVLEPEDTWTKVYNWIVSTGRILLILVAMLVLGVFFSRFVLDKENNDLTDEINSNVNDILDNSVLRQEEIKFRNIQMFLMDVQSIKENQEINSTKVGSVLDTIPSDFNLKSFGYSNGSVNLVLQAGSLEDVGQYTSDLNSNPLYDNVSSSVSKEGQGAMIEFTVNFTVL